MKICLIGQNFGDLTEGMRNITFHLSREVQELGHELLILRQRKAFFNVRKLKNFKPQIIHYVHGPTLQSFIITRFLSLLSKDTKIVMSATQPDISAFSRNLVPFLSPDLILIQSTETERLFTELNCKTEFLPNGVDVDKFAPISNVEKDRLRRKLGIPEKRFIVLHIGSLSKARNLGILGHIQDRIDGVQVVVAGATHVPVDEGTYSSLVGKGCIVWHKFFENVDELYKMADCYLFPTIDKMGCIEFPLTILEAMSCNLSVVSTRIGALPRIISGGDGLFYYNTEQEAIEILSRLKECPGRIDTRNKILPFSWENVGKKLEEVYSRLTNASGVAGLWGLTK